MLNLRLRDMVGNNDDVEAPAIPRIGERVTRRFGIGTGPVTDHYFRVKDVEYRLDNPVGYQVLVLIEEELNPEMWPD